MGKEIEQNMLRERAKKIDEVTDEEWARVNPFNREKVEEFLYESTHLSKYSLKQYKSALRLFYVWVEENLHGKNVYEIKKKDFMRYQNFLVRRGLSSNSIKFKRSAVSSMNKYLINFYEDEPEFETFRNFVEGVPNPSPNTVYNKKPLTHEEIKLINKTLEEDEQWQVLAAFNLLYSSACRRQELIQVKKEVVDYEPIKDKDGSPTSIYRTNEVRAKGRGEQGEVRPLLFDFKTKKYLEKWLEVRGEDDCEYMFISKHNGKVRQIHSSTVNYWFSEVISGIVGRRINPHIVRASRSTHILEDGKDIKQAQKLLSHKQSSTTEQFYDLREDDDDLTDLF